MNLQRTIERFRASSNDVRTLAVPRATVDDAFGDPNAPANERYVNMYPAAAELTRAIGAELSLLKGEVKYRRKAQVVKRYSKDLLRLQRIAASLHDFVKDAVAVGLVLNRPDRLGQKYAEQTLEKVTNEIVAALGDPQLPLGLETTGSLIVNTDVRGLHSALANRLEQDCAAVARSVFGLLQRGSQHGVFGHVHTLRGKGFDDQGRAPAARYFYFTRLLDREGAGRPYEITAIALHLHEVLDARLHAWPALLVRKPRWMWPFVLAIPPVLRSVSAILSGALTVERVLVRGETPRTEEHRIPRPMHLDPALVIAKTFVLTGWNPTDLGVWSNFRHWTPSLMQTRPAWPHRSPVFAWLRFAISRHS